MPALSQLTQKLIQKYQNWFQSLQPKEDITTIHVDEIASTVAAFYEKMRGIVDWREEHLLRKTAIERILKRRLLLQKNGEKIAEPLVYELIRGGHFPNDRIEESKIGEVQKLIDKYAYILENSPSPPSEKKKLNLYNWILGIAACEAEETLSPPLKERALMDYMTETIKEKIRVKEGIIVMGGMTEEEKNTQVYIAVQQALFKLDSLIINYHLLRKRYPQWQDLPSSQLQEISQNIYLIWDSLEKELNHRLADKFYKICERCDTPFLLLGDILSKDPMGAKEKLSQSEVLESQIKEVYNQRLKTLKLRLSRAAFYATLSIFLTNILALLAIEIPFTKYIIGQFNSLAVIIDVLGPTFLMFFLVVTIRPPRKGNLEQVIMETMKIVYERERKDVYEVRIPKKRGFLLNAIISIFYLLAAGISFSVIIWGLFQLNFPPFSYLIFIIFISLIAFAGAKIRERSKELQVTEEKGTFLGFFIDLFSLPVLRLGKWLSARFAKYNVIMVLLNSLIDMPFQVFVEFLEQWRTFLKEKKEEIH